MSVAIYNMEIERGDTYTISLIYKANNDPVDLTGWSFEWEISVDEVSEVYSVGTGVTVIPVMGSIELKISADDTEEFTGRRGFHRLRGITAGGDTVTILKGNVTMTGLEDIDVP